MGLAQKVVLNASALAVGRFVMAGIGIATVAISTRYLGPNAWGQLATATAFIAIVASLTDLGLWTIGARELARRPDESDRVLGGLLTVGFVVSLLGGAAGVGLAFVLYGDSEHQLTREGILLLLLTVPLSAPVGAIGAYFVAEQKAYVGVIASLASSVVTIALIAAAVLLDAGFNAIVWAYVIAALEQAAVIYAFGYGKVRLRPALDLEVSKQLLRWMAPVGGALVIHSLYWRIDIVLLSLLSTASEVALYALVFKIVDVVMVLPNYLHITMMPELARVARTPRFDELMQKTFTVIMVGAVGVSVLFVAFASELTVLAGGEAFADAASILQILMLAVALAYVGSIFGDAFLVHDKLKVSVTVSALVLPANIALNLALISLWDAHGAAVAWVASEALIVATYAVVYRRMFRRLPRMRRAPQVFAAALAMGAVALMKFLPFVEDASALLVLAVGGLLSTIVYGGSLYALKAMPSELHVNLVLPVMARLRPRYRG
jgi:O-antigen/teichoic acid export membrane protein